MSRRCRPSRPALLVGVCGGPLGWWRAAVAFCAQVDPLGLGVVAALSAAAFAAPSEGY